MKSRASRTPLLRWLALGGSVVCMLALLSCGKACQKSRNAPPANPETSRLPAPAPATAAGQSVPVVRVALKKDAAAIALAAPAAGARCVDPRGREILRLAPHAPLNLAPQDAGIGLNAQLLVTGAPVRVESLNHEPLLIDGQPVAPLILVSRPTGTGGARGLNCIAHLDLETYLAGVLAGEVPYKSWHPEAMKAQAVTSRTFALYQLRRNTNAEYDVESTVMSQVFKPGSHTHPAIQTSIEATRGQVLTHGGRVFSAYFHSTCGSHTEPGHLVFPDQPNIPPLAGTACNHCAQSPGYRWNATLEKAVLEQRLKPALPALRGLSAIEFLNAQGQPLRPLERASTVRIKHAGGTATMQGNAFRLAVGSRELKSLSFENVLDRGSAIEFRGAGYGHGVGLCQWGSQGLAQTGYGSEQILGKYFPGAELTRLY